MIKMDLEDFLAERRVCFSTSGYCLDKLRSNRQLRTTRGQKRFLKECEEAEEKYQQKRNAAIAEYHDLVERGEIAPLTKTEQLIRKANGHPDLAATQAARRVCAKRGIDWER